MEAVVTARMKGGDSSRMGRTSLGMVMMWLVLMKAISEVNVSRNDCRSWSGAGWSVNNSSRDLARRLGGIDLFRHFDERALIRMQIVVADLQKPVEGDVDHLVIGKFLAEVFCADAVIAMRFGEKISFQKALVALERVDHLLVDGFELGQQGGIGDVLEGQGHIVCEEAFIPWQLFDGDLGVDLGRILEEQACFDEDLRDEFLAGDDTLQTVRRRGELPTDEAKDAAGDAAGVIVGILLPGADFLEREQVAMNTGDDDVAIGRWRHFFELGQILAVYRDAFLIRFGGVVLQLGVVLMKTGCGAA